MFWTGVKDESRTSPRRVHNINGLVEPKARPVRVLGPLPWREGSLCCTDGDLRVAGGMRVRCREGVPGEGTPWHRTSSPTQSYI